MNIENILNNYFKFDDLVINRFFNDVRVSIKYDRVKEIRKFVFDNYLVWYDEIKKQNKESINPININDFKYNQDVFIASLSNEDKFQIFIEIFLDLTIRFFKYIDEYDLQRVKNSIFEENLLRDYEEKNKNLQELESKQVIEYEKEVLEYEENIKYLDENEMEELKYKSKKYFKDTNSNKLVFIRNYLSQKENNFLKIKYKNIIPDDTRVKIFKDYYIRLRYLAKCFNLRLYKIFLVENISSFKQTNFYNFLPINNKREHLSLNTIDKTPILTQQNYKNKTYADLYSPAYAPKLSDVNFKLSKINFENFYDDVLILS